jgi:glycosyltransferase involved in cell wall biosynthesis
MKEALISCIVPVYNGEGFLREAIESILAQTYRPIEVIIVDDGSTDGTPELARSFGAPVRCIRQDNAGAVAARNRGIHESRGSFLAFLDADDLWLPEKLSRQVAELEGHPSVQCSVCLVQNFWMPELAVEAEAWREHPRAAPIPGYVTDCMLVRREAFDRLGGFDPVLGHGDSADWFLRARAAGMTESVLPEVLVRRRLHSSSLSRREADASRDEFLHLIKRTLDRRRAAEVEEPPP